MIKDQCDNCKKDGTSSCVEDRVYDSRSCGQYVKRINLSKKTDVQEVSPSSAHTFAAVEKQTESKQDNITPNQPTSFSSLFSFKGRIRRTRYWITNILVGLPFVPINIEGDNVSEGTLFFTALIFIPALWILLATTVKRLHDLGVTGWMSLLGWIPLLNFFVGIYIGFFKGQERDNKYGPNPY